MEAGYSPLGALLHQPFWDKLASSSRILIAGCGGGYDFFSGLPLYFALKKAGRQVFLANLTFTDNLLEMTGKRLTEHCLEVTADTKRAVGVLDILNVNYFPELFVSRWFREHEKEEVPVYTLSRTGVRPLEDAYKALVKTLKLDTIILCDGGTDSLMRGDESGLGTPTEDMASIGAVYNLKNVATKLLVCIGMGVDSFHGVCHHHFLENVADIARTGGFLGSFSLLMQMEEAQKMKSAYLASQPINSIVVSSVISAVEGKFGNHHSEHTQSRTKGSTLYISPLMSMYFCFEFTQIAERVLYLKHISATMTAEEVRMAIHKFGREKKLYNEVGMYIGPRKPEVIPY